MQWRGDVVSNFTLHCKFRSSGVVLVGVIEVVVTYNDNNDDCFFFFFFGHLSV